VSVVRIDGTAAPAERVDPRLRGYRGAAPVRFGNAAARQAQLDVPGELLRLAEALAGSRALAPSLAAAAPLLATWIQERWRQPDHGIWEIRGRPRAYTHSRILACCGLEAASRMARRGEIREGADGWAAAASRIRQSALAGGGPLELTLGGGGADSALAELPELGLLPPGEPRLAATLELIAARLDRGGLLDRHEGTRDGLSDPCAPFVFPTFWYAAALAACGADPGRHLRAAASACGRLGLFGEVAEPVANAPLGNYPQVQSHAACVLALTGPGVRPW
jgi:GH15 family glucan-1,4-alpha-glucosidase